MLDFILWYSFDVPDYNHVTMQQPYYANVMSEGNDKARNEVLTLAQPMQPFTSTFELALTALHILDAFVQRCSDLP